MITVTKKLNNTDVNYKIITAGSKFALPENMPVIVEYCGKLYSGKTHSKTVGRIDGMGKLYAENSFSVGDEVTLTYNELTGNIVLTSGGQAAPAPKPVSAPKPAPAPKPASAPKSEPVAPPAQNEQAQLQAILDSLDPVAVHKEYYSSDYAYNVRFSASNNDWIFIQPYSEKSILCSKNGATKFELDLNRDNAGFIGMNNKGIWFLQFGNAEDWKGYQAINKILCYNFASKETRTIRINQKKAYVRNFYICGDIVYYVAEISENRQELVMVTDYDAEIVLHTTYKYESFGVVSADMNRIVYRVDTRKTDCVPLWYVKEPTSSTPLVIGNTRKPDRNDLPLVKIMLIDLKNNIMWTTLTESEQNKLNMTASDLIARRLEEPVDGKFLVYKNTGAPAVFKNVAGINQDHYFDGIDFYYSEHYTSIRRIDRNGNCFELISPSGHGEANRYLVGDDYILLNYDAHAPVCLPRKFSSGKILGKDNPEAVQIIGNVDHRL